MQTPDPVSTVVTRAHVPYFLGNPLPETLVTAPLLTDYRPLKRIRCWGISEVGGVDILGKIWMQSNRASVKSRTLPRPCLFRAWGFWGLGLCLGASRKLKPVALTSGVYTPRMPYSEVHGNHTPITTVLMPNYELPVV